MRRQIWLWDNFCISIIWKRGGGGRGEGGEGEGEEGGERRMSVVIVFVVFSFWGGKKKEGGKGGKRYQGVDDHCLEKKSFVLL